MKKNTAFIIVFLLIFGSAFAAVVLQMTGNTSYQKILYGLCLLGACGFCVFVNIDALKTGRFMTPIWDASGENVVGHSKVSLKKEPRKFWMLFATMIVILISASGFLIALLCSSLAR